MRPLLRCPIRATAGRLPPIGRVALRPARRASPWLAFNRSWPDEASRTRAGPRPAATSQATAGSEGAWAAGATDPGEVALRRRGVVMVITRADRIGGAQVHVLLLARGLRQRGIPVTVATGRPGPFTAMLRRAGIPCHALPSLVRPIRPLADLRALLELRCLLGRLQPALVAAHSTKATWLARLAAACLGIPCVVTVHGWPWETAPATPRPAPAGPLAAGNRDHDAASPIHGRPLEQRKTMASPGWAGPGRTPRGFHRRAAPWTPPRTPARTLRAAFTGSLARWGERLLGRLAAAVITVSRHDYREGLRRGLLDPRRAVVIPNGVPPSAAHRGRTGGTRGTEEPAYADPVRARQPSPGRSLRESWQGRHGDSSGALRVVMVARFEPPKDHATLMQAVALLEHGRIRSRRPGAPGIQPAVPAPGAPIRPLPRDLAWVVELVGDGPTLPPATELARALGVSHRVRFLGARRDGAGAVRGAAVAVLCSHREGLPLVVLEAMAAGVPVVASAVGGVPEAVQHGTSGFLVPPGDPVTLAHYLARLLANPALRQRMGAAARARYEARFTVDRMVDATLALYHQVCGSHWSRAPGARWPRWLGGYRGRGTGRRGATALR